MALLLLPFVPINSILGKFGTMFALEEVVLEEFWFSSKGLEFSEIIVFKS
jgi:hypothetical protein